jgi:hypothetical protein
MVCFVAVVRDLAASMFKERDKLIEQITLDAVHNQGK